MLMDKGTLFEIDRRALDAGITISALASLASVSSATMAKFRKQPEAVRPRTVSKLLKALDAIEREKAA